jgi:hypothetical protein
LELVLYELDLDQFHLWDDLDEDDVGVRYHTHLMVNPKVWLMVDSKYYLMVDYQQVDQQVLKVVGDGDGDDVMMITVIHFVVVGLVEMYDGNDLVVVKKLRVVIEVLAEELEISHHMNVEELMEQEVLSYMQVVEVDLFVILVDDDNEHVNVRGVHGSDDLSVLADNDDDDAHVNLKDDYDYDGDGVIVNVMD